MKKLTTFFFSFFAAYTLVSAQNNIDTTANNCTPQALIDSCIAELEKDNFINIKTFTIQNKEGELSEMEFTYTFAKGITYEYYITCSESLVVTVYDMNKKNIIASNKENPHKVIFECKNTGVHYVHISFKNGTPFCGAAILGFTKNP
ncbi:MAG: hypothetical protein GY827_11740 [Cytophagales bacterium]|nr:hypothetical protein [Cytophagales bacterium]